MAVRIAWVKPGSGVGVGVAGDELGGSSNFLSRSHRLRRIGIKARVPKQAQCSRDAGAAAAAVNPQSRESAYIVAIRFRKP